MIDLVPNLIFVWHCIRASEHLLECAIARSSGELADYFCRHLEEERGHATWLAEDLRSVSVEVSRTRIPREAMEMVGSLYYLIFHVDACALLGYMRVLESCPIKDKLERLEAEYGPELLRTMRYHAEHDPHHLLGITFQTERLTSQQRSLVDQTSGITIEYLQRATESMRAAASKGDLDGREQHRAADALATAAGPAAGNASEHRFAAV
jgi:hypothetical protein